MENKSKRIDLVLTRLISLYFIWGYTPFFRRCASPAVSLSIIAIWIVVWIYRNGGKIKWKKAKIPITLLACALIEGVYLFFGLSTATYGYYRLHVEFYVVMLFGIFLCSEADERCLTIIRRVGFVVILINVFHNIYLYSVLTFIPNPSVVTSPTYYTNVMGSSWAGTLIFIIPLMVLLIPKVEMLYKFLCIVLLLGCVYLQLFKMSRGISIILTLALLLFLLNYSKKDIKRVIISVLIIVVFILLIVNYKSIISFLYGMGLNRLANRLADIYRVLSNSQEEAYSISGRMEMYSISFFSFVQHPLFGIGYDTPVGEINAGVGMHSTVLDLLASYGVFAVAVFAVIIEYYKYIISYIQDRRYLLFYIVFGVYSLLNRVPSAEMGLIIFLYVPTVIKTIKQQEGFVEMKNNSLIRRETIK